jgi:Aspartyl/Asparaginyl beta-hydroxylase
MRAIRSAVNLTDLIREIEHIPLETIMDGSGSSHFGGPAGWITGLSTVDVDHTSYPLLTRTLRDVTGSDPVRLMLNLLRPGAALSPHRDGLPARSRWHFPLVTNPAVLWWDEIVGHVHMEPGCWYGPVNYCGVLHSVVNGGHCDRIHLIADWDVGDVCAGR